VKFADAELIGIPYRITIGPKALADGNVEFTPRATGDTELVALADITGRVAERIAAER
jgi:prolyl-tRNA synthetase